MAKDKGVIPAQEDDLIRFEEDIKRNEERELRDTALRYALLFHSNNGGMLTPDQLIANAQKFTKFLKEDTNV